MSDKLRVWKVLSKTDPTQTKGFKRAGGFSGTAIKPMWVWKRLTELFGPVGEGWGMNEPSFQIVQGENKEVLVYCTVSGWYCEDEARKTVVGVGGDKVVTHIKANEQYNRPERWENDDEAFKKAYTDALMNAFKFVGVAADVHMGLFDDNKYVTQVQEHFEQERQEEVKQQTAAELKRNGAWQAFEAALRACDNLGALEACRNANREVVRGWPKSWQQQALDLFNEVRADIGNREFDQAAGVAAQ
jgi:hypothetical protein